MSLLLYGITDAPSLVQPGPEGLDGGPVDAVTAGPLTAVVSATETAPSLDPEMLWRYEAVVEQLMDGAAVLPVRYGTLLDDAAAVRGMLDARRDEYLASLDRVRGAVELGVRGRWADATASVGEEPPATGTDYLRARLDTRRRAEAVAARVREQLGPRAREVRLRVLPAPTVPVSAAFLIDRAGESDFVSAVGRLEANLQETTLTCTGPWPVYSFVGADA